MSTLKTALKNQGLRPNPIIRQIWQFLKDSGTHNAQGVSKALKLTVENTSSTLGQLRDRGMVSSKLDTDKTTGRDVFYYTVVPKMKSYELQPIGTEAKARKAAIRAKRDSQATAKDTKQLEKLGIVDAGTAHLPKPVMPEIITPVVQTNRRAAPVHILDQISVREAYQLYLELKSMFVPATTPPTRTSDPDK
jgi:hypothetical protein